MSQKLKRREIGNSGPITRTVLREELKRFATKDELFDFKIEVIAELNKAELKAQDREQVYHSDVMTKFDKIMKKLQTMDQENVIGNYRRDEKIENHEKRITSLESSQKI